MEDCEKYLGLSMVGGRSKINTFKDLWEKITKKVLGWKENFILKTGREVLIKTIAQAILTYSMSIFKFRQHYAISLIQAWQNIGRAKQRMRRKFIGLTRRSYVLRRIEAGWGLGKSKCLI